LTKKKRQGGGRGELRGKHCWRGGDPCPNLRKERKKKARHLGKQEIETLMQKNHENRLCVGERISEVKDYFGKTNIKNTGLSDKLYPRLGAPKTDLGIHHWENCLGIQKPLKPIQIYKTMIGGKDGKKVCW